MSQVLTAEQILDLVSRRWPGAEARILQLLGLQALQLRVDLANDGGDLVGVDPPPGYTATTINELLAEIAALGSIGPPGPSIQVLDEGISLTLGATSINFTGAGVTASSVGPVVTVTITSGGGGGSWGSITGTLSAQTDLQAALDGKETAGAAAAAVAAHVAAGDPHPQYLTAAEGNAAFAPLGHVGAGGAAHANAIAAGAAGFMTGTDKTKLDGIATGATANVGTVTSVNAAAPTGFNFTGGPVTGAGTLTLAYAGGYQGFLTTESSKLAGIAAGATANSPDATLLARANHTGTQSVATITGLASVATSGSASDLGSGTLPAARFDDTAHGARAGGTTHAVVVAAGAAGFMTGADKTKLDGVAAGATANSPDATLLARANHTGTQAAASISDFNSVTRAQIEAALIAGANVTITPAGSGATRTFTIAASGGGGSVPVQEEGSTVTASPTAINFVGAGVTATDVAGVATVTIPGGGGSGLAGLATITLTEQRGALEHRQTVTAVGVTAGMKIWLSLVGVDDSVENDPEMMDILALSAKALSGQLEIIAAFGTPTSGPIELNWSAI